MDKKISHYLKSLMKKLKNSEESFGTNSKDMSSAQKIDSYEIQKLFLRKSGKGVYYKLTISFTKQNN
jgi:hypothetical protein